MNIRAFLPILLLFFSLLILKAQDVPQVQMPLITKVTATWCPPCGGWGWDLHEQLIMDNDHKAIILGAHYSGDLLSFVSSDLASNFNVTTQPKFILNNSDIFANSANVASKRMEVQEMVNQMSADSPSINTGLQVTRANDKYTIKTKTKFFEEVTGNVHLSIIALENDVLNYQATRGESEHPHVIRGTIGSETFGQPIAQGTIAAGTEIEETYIMDIEAGWNTDNVTIVALLWSEQSGDFIYLNGNRAEESVVNVHETLSADNFAAEWRGNGAESFIHLDAKKILRNSTLSLFGSNGQLLNKIYEGNLDVGVHQFELPKTLTSGHYFIRIRTDEGEKSFPVQL